MSGYIKTVNLPVTRREQNSFKSLLAALDRFFWRALEILVAFCALIILSPVFGLIALAIRRDSPGPVFFKGRRIGHHGRLFKILKFRTMYETPESYQGSKVTASDDGRVTPIGHWLRETKVNELPQLWNVLVGDMSLVGPRPEDPDIAAEWPSAIREEILSVRPGITSPASVLYRDEEEMLSAADSLGEYMNHILPSKLRLDLLYVRNRSFLSDLDIVFLTGVALLPVFRKKAIPGRMLFNGPFKLFTTRFLNWFTIDLMIALVSVWTAGLIYRSFEPINLGWQTCLVISAGMAIFFSLINLCLGLNRISWSKAQAASALDLGISAAVSVGLMLVISRFIPSLSSFPPGIMVISGILAAIGFVGVRYRERLVTGFMNRYLNARQTARSVKERILVVGAGEMGEFAAWFFGRSDFARTFHVVGFVDDDPRLDSMQINGRHVLGPSSDIPALVEQHDVGLIVFAITRIDEEQRQQILEICRSVPVRLVLFPDLVSLVNRCIDSEQPIPVDLAYATRSLYDWLDNLDEHIQQGDISGAREMIGQMKNKQADNN